MKQDAKADERDGPEREELRALLRQWPAPQAPPEIEDALRREFRRRRSRMGFPLWVPLAAAATLIVAWQMRPAGQPSRSPLPEAPAASAPSPAAPRATVGRDRVSGTTPALVEPIRARRRPIQRPRQPEVIVEAGQAALLAELGRKLSRTHHAVPGTVIPQMPEVEVPRYLEEWQAVAGEGPVVQESDSMGGR